MNEPSAVETPMRWRVLAAFAAIYLIWGSTYLGIRFAIETLPPLLMAATRFIIAGTALYGWLRLRGAPRPTRANWGAAAVVGGLLLLGGNGIVTWAEQRVPSGLAALLIATVPLWMVLLNWLRPGGTRPSGQVIFGLVCGLVGMALLIGPADLAGNGALDPVGALALVLAALSWSVGSLYSRRAPLAKSPLLATGMEMLMGGLLLLAAGSLTGEWARLDLGSVSLLSVLALGYLIVFGSLIAFSAYVWLLRVTTPARAATYAYVNPVVAVFLGWALAGEPLNARILLAAAIIIAAVVIITSERARQEAPVAQTKVVEPPLVGALPEPVGEGSATR